MVNILQVSHVVKRYAHHTALNDVSICIPRQSIFGLLGPNGAGKTSLIRIVTQITAPDSGEILFNGEKLHPRHIARIGYLPEERGLYKKMKVGEQLLYLAQLKGMTQPEARQKLRYWFEKFDISTWWGKQVEDLSKGMQQKIQFVATVLHEPELIILDEPFSGFDPINANVIKNEILELRKKGSTIIFSTHRMESVEELCDHIALINRSEKVLDGSTQSVRNRFRSNTFFVEFEGTLPLLPSTFEVLDTQLLEAQESTGNLYRAKIRIHSPATTNDLIAALIPQIRISSFRESIPSMNDIFISSVTGVDTEMISGQTRSIYTE
jgi:ABC-2 type transport system ATP-binding protein